MNLLCISHRTLRTRLGYSLDSTAQKLKFSVKGFFSKCDQIHSFFADLVTFTEEILN